MKGQQEALSAILITTVLIGVVGSVYFWGLPLVQKNKDITTLENSESFMRKLDEKIKYIANNGGREQMKISVPGVVTFDAINEKIELAVNTQGVIYAVAAEIPLGMNDCSSEKGTLGVERAEVLCVRSDKIADNNYITKYILSYLELTQGRISYKIDLTSATGETMSSGMDHFLVIENKGSVVDGNLIKTVIEINII